MSAAQKALNFDRPLWRQIMGRAVNMRLKGNALFGQFAQLGERHHLKAAGVGEDRMRPIHEFVQAPKRGDALRCWSQHQVIGIAEHNIRASLSNMLWEHRLHRRRRTDRHESGRSYIAARCGHDACARPTVSGV